MSSSSESKIHNVLCYHTPIHDADKDPECKICGAISIHKVPVNNNNEPIAMNKTDDTEEEEFEGDDTEEINIDKAEDLINDRACIIEQLKTLLKDHAKVNNEWITQQLNDAGFSSCCDRRINDCRCVHKD